MALCRRHLSIHLFWPSGAVQYAGCIASIRIVLVDQLIKVHDLRRDLVILMSVELVVQKNRHCLTLITHRNAVSPYFSPIHYGSYL